MYIHPVTGFVGTKCVCVCVCVCVKRAIFGVVYSMRFSLMKVPKYTFDVVKTYSLYQQIHDIVHVHVHVDVKKMYRNTYMFM